MELSRRHAIAGAAVALAGCSELRMEVEERADGVRSLAGHPLAGTTTISVVDRSDGSHDVHAIAQEAAGYWNEHAGVYTDVDVTFVLDHESPDIELVFLADRTGLEGCQEHASREILGCAPLLRPGHRPERPITVEVVAAGQPYGDVRTTAKHELGHTLGLDHDDEPAYIMSNDVRDRLPEYHRRLEILDTVENAWNGRNAATREYNRGIDRWNDGEYTVAADTFDAAAERYRVASASVDTAMELETGFDGMNRPETVDREALREGLERAHEWIDLAVERSKQMAESAGARDDGDVSTARVRRQEAERAFEQLKEVAFPAPVDIARTLGLVRERVTTTEN